MFFKAKKGKHVRWWPLSVSNNWPGMEKLLLHHMPCSQTVMMCSGYRFERVVKCSYVLDRELRKLGNFVKQHFCFSAMRIFRWKVTSSIQCCQPNRMQPTSLRALAQGTCYTVAHLVIKCWSPKGPHGLLLPWSGAQAASSPMQEAVPQPGGIVSFFPVWI